MTRLDGGFPCGAVRDALALRDPIWTEEGLAWMLHDAGAPCFRRQRVDA